MSLFDGIGKLRGGLDYHLARQNVLVSNLAQLDTPNYKPIDLERTPAAFQKVLHAELTATNEAHFGGASGRQESGVIPGHVVNDPSAAAGADGNGVNVDREAAKIAANQVRYDVLTKLVSGELSGLDWACNDGRRG